MTEEKSPTETKAERSQPRALVTAADFEAVDFEAPIRGLDTTEAHEFYQAYERAFHAARQANDEVAQTVYRLLAQLCSMTLRPPRPTFGRARLRAWSTRWTPGADRLRATR
jgi:cytochrome c5